jgi:hypothetical protein
MELLVYCKDINYKEKDELSKNHCLSSTYSSPKTIEDALQPTRGEEKTKHGTNNGSKVKVKMRKKKNNKNKKSRNTVESTPLSNYRRKGEVERVDGNLSMEL